MVGGSYLRPKRLGTKSLERILDLPLDAEL
jgi:hypothetical protein